MERLKIFRALATLRKEGIMQKHATNVSSGTAKRILYASRSFNEDLTDRVAHEVNSRGWQMDLQMCLTQEIPESWSGDGIITQVADKQVRSFFARAGCPVLSLNLNIFPSGIPCVANDPGEVSRMAAEHFLQRGFHHFAFCPYPVAGEYTAQRNMAAFCQRLESEPHTFHHIERPRTPSDTGNRWAHRQKWIRQQLVQLPKPVAIFSYDAALAIEIVEACHAEQLHIPDQVSVLNVFGFPFLTKCSRVPLSAIEYDNNLKVRVACDLLEAMMNGAPAPKEPVLIPIKGITTRASTDTIAASTPSVAKAIRFMLDHYADSISTNDTMRISGLSRTALFTAFKKDIGQTPHAVLTHIRLDKAKNMLRETDAKLHEVAEACGFNHPVGLHHHFKQALNMSPGAYRQHARTE
jgi:LacI family transcriptional regulator